ncbi:hypothetical protein [Vulcanisaeta distributa]|uniref:hypothetical protein n=1 Tax=Vulcanisaeta distributa TaxID=164451 RepID=UPI0006D085E5|nr:hypothetical protein [Vulcanisaeta distributa]
MNFLEQLATSGISSVLSTILSGGVASLVMGSAAVALALIAIYQLTRESTKHSPGEFIELMRHWATLHPSLRKIIASKIAIQLGITPSEAEDAINQVTRLSEEQLRQLVEVVQNRLRELEKRVERLEGNVRLLESQVKGFVIYRLGDIADGKLYPNIELVGNDLGVVSETYGRVEVNIVRAGEFDKYLNQVIDGLKNGLVVLTGPKGIGKSTLALYGIWELLRSGGYYGVVKLENIGNDDVRLAIENFLETYKRDFINSFGKLVLLYDPSTATAYASLGVAINVRDVEVTLRQLMKLADRLSELEASLIIVMPSDLYNGLGDKDVKEFLNKHSINVNLRSSEFIKAIIKAYAGCSISEDVLNTITSEVLKFNEGYTLIARIIGEGGLRRSNCLVADIQAMLREAHGDASAFLIRWINGYLRGIPIDRVSEVLTIREQFKNEVGPGDYVATPTLIEKLLTIGSKVKEEEEVSLIEERANWLAVRHEDLLEDAITRIVKTAMGETVTGSEHLIKALKPWSKYGKFKGKINEVSDAVKYINERYGKELGEEFKNISSDCWNAIVLALGTTWNVRSLKAVIEGFEGVTGLMPIVNSALRTIRSVNCDAVRLMIINNEIPPLTRELLGVIAKSQATSCLTH